MLSVLLLFGLALAQESEGEPSDDLSASQPETAGQVEVQSGSIFPTDSRPFVEPFPGLSVEAWLESLGPDASRVAENESLLRIHVSALAEVANGEEIVYTITLTNTSTTANLRNILLSNVLPLGTLHDVECGSCVKDQAQIVFKDQFGEDIVISETRAVSWSIDTITPGLPGQATSVTRSFKAKVVGQSDGAVIKNQAFANYQVEGQPGSSVTSSNEVRSNVRIPVVDGEGLTVSSVPTWFSSDRGGTLSMDWGDYNRDGNLDLALASSGGTTVYRNENGQLRRLWSNSQPSFGVRWGDFTGNGRLDLVVVGDQSGGMGINYVYTISGNVVQEASRFTSTQSLARVASGDFTGDGNLDLVVSTNAINAACPVMLYTNDGKGNFAPAAGCISQRRATASIGVIDVDNNGHLDLVLGLFPNTVRLFRNGGKGVFTQGPEIDAAVSFLPYDFAVGDFNGDGYLDLAAAYPLLRQARIYRNTGTANTPFELVATIRTDRFLTPFSLDWGDFTGDGKLDLAVADVRPKVYSWVNGSFQLVEELSTDSLNVGGRAAQVWSLRGVDVDNDGDLDLALTNRDGSSLIFTNFAPHLSTTLTPVPATADATGPPASSVIWADIDGDGYLDLIFGAGPVEVATKRYLNRLARFQREDQVNLEGFGPHVVAVGDVTKDGRMDLAIGTPGGIAIYLGENAASPDWRVELGSRPTALAWGDYDDDGDLDLLVGAEDGSILLFVNQASTPGNVNLVRSDWQRKAEGPIRSLAWADLTGNHYLDFGVGVEGGPNRIYLNDRGKDASKTSFTQAAWNPTVQGNLLRDQTRAMAWGDYDGDGRLDLAVGNFGERNYIYRNLSQGGQFVLSDTPVWTSPTVDQTTSLAWGDWNNNGVLDLAVGNYEEADQVWVNRRDPMAAGIGEPRFSWLWSSSEKQKTTGIAWGDVDGDGDLDLAVSQEGGGRNGYYLNHLITPAHLKDTYAAETPLPTNLNYLHVERPGNANSAYLYSSPQILGSSNQPTVTVQFRVYDADGRRNAPGSNVGGAPIPMSDFRFEYSLDGGGTWRSASPAVPVSPGQIITPTRLGTPVTFIWNARADAAISENARFRVVMAQSSATGAGNRARSGAVSPPFRVRATTCLWPQRAAVSPLIVERAQTPVDFTGSAQASGLVSFSWDFGNGVAVAGQRVSHQFPHDGIFPVKLTVTGQPCPIPRPLSVTVMVRVGSGVNPLYLPLIAGGGGAMAGASALEGAAPQLPDEQGISTEESPAVERSTPEQTPLPVADLVGVEQADAVVLTWQQPANAKAATGYRVYRSQAEGDFVQVVRLAATRTSYRDANSTCGAAYFVTAIGPGGESPASNQTFYTSPCGGVE